MIRLASIIEQFERDFLKTCQGKLLPSQLKALQALKNCRTQHSPMMRVSCVDCDHQVLVPHSCGHRSCPHCQHHDKSAGKPVCTASAARRVNVQGRTFMNPNSGLSNRFKNNYPFFTS